MFAVVYAWLCVRKGKGRGAFNFVGKVDEKEGRREREAEDVNRVRLNKIIAFQT